MNRRYFERKAEPMKFNYVFYNHGDKYFHTYGKFCLNDNYIWRCHVYSQYRNMGYYKEMLKFAIDRCYKQGHERVFIACDEDNEHSCHGVRSVGFKTIFRVPQKEKKSFWQRLIAYKEPDAENSTNDESIYRAFHKGKGKTK